MASTDAFIAHQANPRIYHDPGAEHYARLLIPILSACITQIEQKQQAPFTEDIKIFVCASQESFNTLVPRGIRAKGAMFLEKLFLSPRAFETDRHQGILTHELSHLHMIQTMGGSPTRRVFRSGFRRGWLYLYRKVAAPCTDYNTTCFTARVTMFVKYLHDRDLQSYQRFLKAISQGTPFRDAVEILGGSTEHLWRQFIEDLK